MLANQLKIEASYVGSRSHDAPVNNSYNSLSVSNLALGDASKGGNPNTLNNRVPNPFQGLLPGTSLNSATVPVQQLLLPFPQFTNFTQQNLAVGKVWYNSLQVSVQKRYSKGLGLTGSYTLSKNIQALNYLNPTDLAPSNVIVPFDRTHVFVLAPIYELPFGPGREAVRLRKPTNHPRPRPLPWRRPPDGWCGQCGDRLAPHAPEADAPNWPAWRRCRRTH